MSSVKAERNVKESSTLLNGQWTTEKANSDMKPCCRSCDHSDYKQHNIYNGLNPLRRGEPENGDCRRRNLVSCKKATTVSTMNVRPIRGQHCREELVSDLIDYTIEVLGIQEHRIVHDEPVRYENIIGRTLVTTTATRNNAGAATGGVGIVLNTQAKRSLSSVKAHTSRILIANFQGNPATSVIVNYSPTNVADEKKKSLRSNMNI